MAIDVHADPTVDYVATNPVPETVSEPVANPLGNLKARRQAIADKLHKVLQVPRWEDPEIFVRFKPVDQAWLEKAAKKRSDEAEKTKQSFLVLISADILATACEGVFAKLPDDETEYSLRVGDPEGRLTRFDEDLATAIGAPPQGAAYIVRSLYQTDGDIIAAANELQEWSGIASNRIDEDF